MTKFKPLLASKADLEKLRFPLLASPKLDGIRCLIVNGQAVTRTLKPIPNRYIREHLSHPDLDGLDGEIVTQTLGERDDFNTLSSKVMRADGESVFAFHVFDTFENPTRHFVDRALSASFTCRTNPMFTNYLEHHYIENLSELMEYEEEAVNAGFEGVMLRDPNGVYKFGRSTVNEGILLKMKRFHDAEAIIVGFKERMHNANEAKTDALGHTERSSHKAGKVPTGTLGAFQCVWKGKVADNVRLNREFNSEDVFEVGTGFTEEQRKELWKTRPFDAGKIITVTYQELTPDGKPRFPVFKGFRSTEDVS